MNRLRIALVCSVFLLLVTAAWAGDPKKSDNQTQKAPTAVKAPPAQTIAPPTSVGGIKPGLISQGVHINSVHLEGNCGDTARFVVEIQNNLTKVAHVGLVFVGSANSPGNRAGNPTANFENLQPGEHRTLTLNSRWRVPCSLDELGQPGCFEVGIVMESDNTANGEVWDGIWHRVCSNPPRNAAPVVTDTTHQQK
jgi:hypothetical protein